MKRSIKWDWGVGMDNQAIAEKSFFAKLASVISNAFRSKKKKDYEHFSRFVHFLNGLDKSSELYKTAHLAVIACDESMNVVSQRMMLIKKLKETDEKLAELECYNQLTDEEAAHLKDLLARFASLVKDKNVLKYQVTGFDKSISYMSDMEKEAPLMLDEMKEAEDKQRIFKKDIGYLQGEKSELEYEQDNILFAMNFIHKFTIGFAIFFAAVLSVMVFMYVFNGAQILFPASVMFVAVAVMAGLLYTLRKKLKFELQLNYKKQNKAVGLINKKSVVYAHYTNFLNFEYRKFKVRNSDMLKNNLKEYAHYKHLTKRFDSIRSIMYQTEEEIEKFLRAKNISGMSTTIEKFAQTVDVDDKKMYHNELLTEKAALERNLAAIDLRQERIWDELVALNERDKSPERLIDAIIKTYVDEAGKIVSRFSEVEVPDGETKETSPSVIA